MKKLFTLIISAAVAISASAAANIAGQYLLKAVGITNNVNTSAAVTIKAGATEGAYTVTGVFPGSDKALNATFANGVLTIPMGQAVLDGQRGEDTYTSVLEAADSKNNAVDLILALDEKTGVFTTESPYVVAMIREGKFANYYDTALMNYEIVPVNGDITSLVYTTDSEELSDEKCDASVVFNFDENNQPVGGFVAGFNDVTWLSFTVDAENIVKFNADIVREAIDGEHPLDPATPIEWWTAPQYFKGITAHLDMNAGTITIDHDWTFAAHGIAYNREYYSYIKNLKKNSVINFKGNKEHLLGDVNLSGMVDVEDLNIVINIVNGLDNAEKYDGRADLNGDGSVDVADINMLIDLIMQ